MIARGIFTSVKDLARKLRRYINAYSANDKPIRWKWLLGLNRSNVANLPHQRYSCAMRPIRYFINVTLDGCCDHREAFVDEDLFQNAIENINRAAS